MKPAVFALKLLISVGLLAFLAWRAAREEQFHGFFEGRNYLWLGGAFAAGVLATLVTFFRWYLLARGLGLALGLGETLRVSFISAFLGLFAFGVVGTDSARAWTAAHHSPGKRLKAVASVLVDRTLGLLVMFLFAAGGYYWQPAERWAQLNSLEGQGVELVVQFSGWAAAVLVSCGMLALLAPSVLGWPIFARLRSWPLLGDALGRSLEVVELYRQRPGVLAAGLFLSVLSTLLFTLSIYLLAQFYGGSHPSLADHCIIAPISLVANAAPLPGGLGGMETMLDFLYRAFAPTQGEPPKGVVIAFAFRFILLSIAAGGAFAWFRLSRSERAAMQRGGLE